jgi:hypothetical protein
VLERRIEMKDDTPKTTPKRGGRQIDTAWHGTFLTLLAETGNITLAARGAGVDRGTAYDHKHLFPEFSEAWEMAIEEAVDILEAEAWRRAKSQSDTLMIFLLKGLRPGKYREIVKQVITGPAVLPISLEALKRMAQEVMDDDERR